MLLEKALIFVFSRKCFLCGKRNEESICKKCFDRLNKLQKCKKIDFENKNLNSLIYFFKYEKIIRRLILQFKFFNKPYIGKLFSKIILKNEKFCGKIKFYDIIIPVPMHKEKKNIRGYNQTEIIAGEIAKNLNIKYENKLLIKNVNTKMQSSLTEKERYENIKNVFFIVNDEKIKRKNIILIDDIYTTGATLDECANVLKNAGANKVCGVVIAKD